VLSAPVFLLCQVATVDRQRQVIGALFEGNDL